MPNHSVTEPTSLTDSEVFDLAEMNGPTPGPWLALLAGAFLAVALSSCIEKGSLVDPTPLTEPSPPPSVPPGDVIGIVVNGPRDCTEADTLPAVVVWVVENIPPGTDITSKGYFWDDTVNCDATQQQGRTQNSHLRIIPLSATSIRIEYDRDTNPCRGRSQVDVGTFFGRIIQRSNGKVCKDAPTPEPPVVTPPPPVPPTPEPEDCPKPDRHHCEKKKHRDCRSDHCRRDKCHT